MSGARLTREEAAKIELGRTEVHPIVARVLLAVLLVTAALPACVQTLAVLAERKAASPAPPGSASTLGQARSAADFLALVPTVHQIRAFEEELEDASLISRALRPWVGCVVKGLLRGGDEQVYFGHEGWLFYRASVDSVTGPGFLAESWQRRRLRAADPSLPPPQPDPLEALLQFHRQLEERGIALVVMPIPGKESIYPETLAPSQSGGAVVQNPSFEAFKSRLSAAGVHVFDPAPILAALKRETPAYLRTDTHWSPAAVQRVAVGLAAWLTERNFLPPVASTPSRYFPAAVRNRGDITVMGDSFNNIYSLAEMGWGDSAGFAEHLGAALDRPLDRLVINAGGAHTTRQELVREMAAGRDRPAGKRGVIYEFAARELAFGDWKLFDLPHGAPQVAQAPAPGGGCIIHGRIAAMGRLPKPGSVPYRDCVLSIHLTDGRGLPAGDDKSELLVYAMGMKDNQWLPVSSLTSGREVHLSNWTPHYLLFGDEWSGERNWSGTLEGVAVFSRALSAEQVKRERQAYQRIRALRPPVLHVVLDAEPITLSRVPTLQEISPYREALIVAEYRVKQVVEGELKTQTVRVAHWALLDGAARSPATRKPGWSGRLTLETFEANPQLKSLFLSDTLDDDFKAVLYYDPAI